MRALFISVLAVLLVLDPADASTLAVVRRQDEQSISNASPTRSAASSAGTESSPPSSMTQSLIAESTPVKLTESVPRTISTATRLPSTTPSLNVVAHASTTHIATAQESALSNGTASSSSLPIQPKLSPAMGISGVLLLLSGVVYTFIGIKNKWLYVFASSAYLTSLAVTVLIIYLMNPPVTDAVQGAFFVVAFVTGCIFGGLSLVFSDITDGFGCLLGGFCLSMWFLTLKDGGLIPSVTGRRIFIAAMSAVGFCFSFSHHTRTYGLIACISFAGATATMLGIDCLSRAGWKEFWIYLWDLNNKEFPLDTETYPVTRGIKVEVAGVIILFICGIISQLKLWKLVQEHRAKKTAIRLQEEQRLEQEDEEVGRRVENNILRERAQWEATYGDKAGPHVDSVIDSSKNSHLRTSNETMELKDMGTNHNMASPTVTVTAVQEDEIQQVNEGRGVSNSNPFQPSFPDHAPRNGPSSSRSSSEINKPMLGSNRNSLRLSLPPPPAVVPLPFSVPAEEDGDKEHEDNSSVSVIPDSTPEPVTKRQSFNAPGRFRLSTGRSITANSESMEALVVPHIEDDRSSIAATLDKYDLDDLYELSVWSSHRNSRHDKPAASVEDLSREPTSEEHVKTVAISGALEPSLKTHKGREIEQTPDGGKDAINTQSIRSDAQPEAISLTPGSPPCDPSLSANTKLRPDIAESKRLSLNNATAEAGPDEFLAADGLDGPKSSTSNHMSAASQTGLRRESLRDLLPDGVSKVVLSYRTNEWAKHLEQAEKPEIEKLAEPESPGVQLDLHVSENFPPATKETTPTEPSFNVIRTSVGTNPYRNAAPIRSTSNLSRRSQTDLPSASLSRSSSFAPLAAPADPMSNLAAGKPRGLRISSTSYLGKPIAESPVEAEFETRQFTPSPVPGNTLLEKRETLLQNRAVSQSFTPYTSTSSLDLRGLEGSTTRAKQAEAVDLSLADKMRFMDQENMTLAQRKQLIQGSRPPSSSQKRRSSGRPAAVQLQGFDSHQPKRPSSMDQEKREVLLANWRESIRQDMSAQTVRAGEDSRRVAMINNTRQKELEKQQQAAAGTYRAAMVDEIMRSGEMLDAHREAMRRLQANANKNV